MCENNNVGFEMTDYEGGGEPIIVKTVSTTLEHRYGISLCGGVRTRYYVSVRRLL